MIHFKRSVKMLEKLLSHVAGIKWALVSVINPFLVMLLCCVNASSDSFLHSRTRSKDVIGPRSTTFPQGSESQSQVCSPNEICVRLYNHHTRSG